jgi:hypothetical protein
MKRCYWKVQSNARPKQEIEAFNALQAFQQLMNLKSAQEAQYSFFE